MSVEITPAIITSFRQRHQAYTDVTRWPDDIVTDALIEADAETGSNRWGAFNDDGRNFKRRGMFLYAAHWMAVEYLQQTAADPTAVSPTARLNVASKSVGDESIGYRIGAIQETENDWLSLTNYGVQYLRLRGRAGKGAVAV